MRKKTKKKTTYTVDRKIVYEKEILMKRAPSRKYGEHRQQIHEKVHNFNRFHIWPIKVILYVLEGREWLHDWVL